MYWVTGKGVSGVLAFQIGMEDIFGNKELAVIFLVIKSWGELAFPPLPIGRRIRDDLKLVRALTSRSYKPATLVSSFPSSSIFIK